MMFGEYRPETWTIQQFLGIILAIALILIVYGLIFHSAIKKKDQEYYKKEGLPGEKLVNILASFPVAFPVLMILLIVLIPMAIDYINHRWGMGVIIFLFMGFICLIGVVTLILQKMGVIDNDEEIIDKGKY